MTARPVALAPTLHRTTRRGGPAPGAYQGPPVDVAGLLGLSLADAFNMADLSIQAAADELGTGRQTVRRWIQGCLVGAQFAPKLLLLLGRHDLAAELTVTQARQVQRPDYADAVRDRLAELDMSNAGLVAATGVSRTSLYAWMAGQSSLSDDNLARVCEALGWPAGHLGWPENMPATPGPVWQARLDRRMSRRRLVAAAGITEPTLRRIEAGGEASPAQLVKVAASLRLDETARAELLTQRRRPRHGAFGPARSWDDPAPATTLGRWVEEAAAPHGWTRNDVARHLSVTRQALNLWLTGSARIANAAVLARVAQLVGRTSDEVTAAMAATPHPWARAGDQLRAVRQEHGLSQRELAGHLGVEKTQLASWELGVARPSIRHRQTVIDWVTQTDHPLSEASASLLAMVMSSEERLRTINWVRQSDPQAFADAARRALAGALDGQVAQSD